MTEVYIAEWGSPYENMTPEAVRLRNELLARGTGEEQTELLHRIWDITDTRRFCIVTSREDGIFCLRHIFRVTDSAEEHLEELKAEYYKDYAQLPTDEFHFCTGYHRAVKYSEERKEKEI